MPQKEFNWKISMVSGTVQGTDNPPGEESDMDVAAMAAFCRFDISTLFRLGEHSAETANISLNNAGF